MFKGADAVETAFAAALPEDDSTATGAKAMKCFNFSKMGRSVSQKVIINVDSVPGETINYFSPAWEAKTSRIWSLLARSNAVFPACNILRIISNQT